jgi:hypothetical protein
MLERTIDEWAALDVSELCDAEIRLAHVELRRMIDRLEAVDARVLAGVHQRMIHVGDGSPSAAAWSQAQTGSGCRARGRRCSRVWRVRRCR